MFPSSGCQEFSPLLIEVVSHFVEPFHLCVGPIRRTRRWSRRKCGLIFSGALIVSHAVDFMAGIFTPAFHAHFRSRTKRWSTTALVLFGNYVGGGRWFYFFVHSFGCQSLHHCSPLGQAFHAGLGLVQQVSVHGWVWADAVEFINARQQVSVTVFNLSPYG